MFTMRPSDYRVVERSADRSAARAISSDEMLSRLPQKGDTVRDEFTRYCLYLASFAKICDPDRIIVAIGHGNSEAILTFEDRCRNPNNMGPSAQHFAVATTSAAATSVNIHGGARGGNVTIGAGSHGLYFALIAAGMFVTEQTDGVAHLFWEQNASAGERDTIAYCSVSRDPGRLVTFDLDFEAFGVSQPTVDPDGERSVLEAMCADREGVGRFRLGAGWITSRPLHRGPLYTGS